MPKSAQITALEAEVDALEKEVKALDAEIAAEEKTRRATLFGSTGGPARATVVNDLDPERTGGFHNLADFAVAVRNLQVDGIAWIRGLRPPRPAISRTRARPVKAFLVPTEWREQIWSLVFDNRSARLTATRSRPAQRDRHRQG
jgi:hypothetical protein